MPPFIVYLLLINFVASRLFTNTVVITTTLSIPFLKEWKNYYVYNFSLLRHECVRVSVMDTYLHESDTSRNKNTLFFKYY